MEKINILISLILICFLLVILSIEKSKITQEGFYNLSQNNTISNNTQSNNTHSPSISNTSNNTHSTNEQQNVNSNSSINETQLMEMCKNMNKGPQNSIRTLRLSNQDLNSHVLPAFWFNENICFYRILN